MFIIKTLRKFFSLLRSDLSGHEIGLGFCVGILLGCIPLSSLCSVLGVLVLMIVFRASFSAFFFAALVVKLLSPVVDPATFRLGEWMLEGPLSGFFGWIVNQPVLALLDLHRYVLAGGILFTLLCSVVAYPVLSLLTRKYRETVLRWTETSPAFEKFTRFFLIRFLAWLFMGKKKGDYAEVLATKKSPIRTGAVTVLVVFIAAAWLFGALFGDAVAKSGFEAGASRVSDRKVTTELFALSLLQGRLDLEDMRVYDVDEAKGIARAIKVSGDLSIRELLRRHFVFDEIIIENMDFKVERDKDGNLNIKGSKKKIKGPEEESFFKGSEYLANLWQQKDMATDLLETLLDYMFPTDEEIDPRARVEEIKEAYAQVKRYADIFADFLLEGDQPLVVVNNLWIRGLKLELDPGEGGGKDQLFQDLTLHATALSSNPALYGRDCVIKVGNNGLENPSVYLKFTLNWSNPEPEHRLTIKCLDLPSDQVQQIIQPGDDILFESGTVHFESDTLFVGEGLTSNTSFRLREMVLEPARPGKKILGLESKLFCRGLTEIMKDGALETSVKISGPYSDLSIDVDDQGLLDSVKEGIMRSGERLLQEQLDEQMDKARALADEKMQETMDKLTEKQKKAEDKLMKKLGGAEGENLGDQIDDVLKGDEAATEDLLNKAGNLFGNDDDDDEKKDKKKDKKKKKKDSDKKSKKKQGKNNQPEKKKND